jgi:hypothetical protein|tara:strand:+ start:1808 stop:1972 length:165 start_codon:yes stop_codon:yes gene_type:complete
MTLEESFECEDLTPEEARLEIERHASDGGWKAFIHDCGQHETYTGEVVLGWLGY